MKNSIFEVIADETARMRAKEDGPFAQGTNHHGVSYKVYKIKGREQWIVELFYEKAQTYKSGSIALDVALNTKLTSTIEREE